ncbi:MAG TPA: ECF-type sigma factor [Gemmatimonadales bacterium]|nr:ECF-type sigma factor [Gemmatimonadales bacterium]
MTSAESPGSGEVARLLAALRAGDPTALDRILPLLYGELRELAGRVLARERAPVTLLPTDLVHEAYLKLGGSRLAARDRAHFLAIAARAMRQVLVDRARRRLAAKRGGDAVPVTLSDAEAQVELALGPDELVALDDALAGLEPRQRQLVECRFFGGMEEAEVAEALGVSVRTVRREWVKARAWLYRALYREPEAEG